MRKALIIEDEPDLCQLLSLHLTSLDIENEYVHCIKDAKDKILSHSFEFVLLDLHLGNEDGFELITWLNELNSGVKIIVLSGYDMERKQAADLNVELFLAKPFTKTTIRLAIEAVLKKEISDVSLVMSPKQSSGRN